MAPVGNQVGLGCAPVHLTWNHQQSAQEAADGEKIFHFHSCFRFQLTGASLQMGLQPTFDNIHNSLATIDGRMLSPDQLLDPQGSAAEGKGRKGRKVTSEVSPQAAHQVDLFMQVSMRHSGKECCCFIEV